MTLATLAAALLALVLTLGPLALGAFFFVRGCHGIDACADHCASSLGRSTNHRRARADHGPGDAAGKREASKGKNAKASYGRCHDTQAIDLRVNDQLLVVIFVSLMGCFGLNFRTDQTCTQMLLDEACT